jgi:hypothetical protein
MVPDYGAEPPLYIIYVIRHCEFLLRQHGCLHHPLMAILLFGDLLFQALQP